MNILHNYISSSLPLRFTERGNIFFMLFGAVALVGVLGAATVSLMRGPLSTMVEVNRRTMAESQMSIASKLGMMTSALQANDGDCEAVPDGFVEPYEWEDASNAGPDGVAGSEGGGWLANAYGVSKKDPWGTNFGYCVWDTGTTVADAGCGGAGQKRLAGSGTADRTYPVLALISAGPDRTFQTGCVSFATGDANSNATYDAGEKLVVKAPGSDDVVLEYTYAEASMTAGGLWELKAGQPDTAETPKSIEVGGGANFAGGSALIDPTTGQGTFPRIVTDFAQANTAPTIDFVDGLKLTNTGSAGANCSIGSGGPGLGTLAVDNANPTVLLGCLDNSGTPEWTILGGVGVDKWLDGTDPGDIHYPGGMVGIGTVNPSRMLDVAGDAGLTGDLFLADTKGIRWGDASTRLQASGPGSLEILTGGSTRFSVDSSGLAGLGVAPTANTRLVIQGTGTTSASAALKITDSAAATVLYVQDDKKVGIGTVPNDALDVTGAADVSLGYKIDGNVVVYVPDGVAENILIGKDAGSLVTGDRNAVVGASAAAALAGGTDNVVVGQGAAGALSGGDYNTLIGQGVGPTLATGVRNILIGAHDSVAVDVPAAATDDYLNIGNTIYGDMANDYVGIGVPNPNDALDVAGNIDATGNVNTGGNFTINSVVFGPALECTAAQKLEWDNATGWSCVTDLNDGSAGSPDTLEEVLTAGNDANTLTAVNLGGVAIGSTTLSTGGTQDLELDVTGDIGADWYCDANGNNCFNASSVGSLDTFLELTDTPNAYTGAGTWLVRVNAGATALEFVNPSTLSTAAAGNTGEVQYNNGGAFAASANFFWDNAAVELGIGTNAPGASLDISTTDSVILPRGTTAQRSGTPVSGMIRYNNTANKFEVYENGAWKYLQTGTATALAFTDLSDTPAVYTGAAYKLAMVNPTETGIVFSYNDAVLLPSGTTAERPATATNGMIRYNGTDNRFEVYQNGAWVNLITSGAGSALALDDLTDVMTDYPDRNMFLGVGGASLTSGYSNTSLGDGSLLNVADGSKNTALGKWALYNLTSGYDNTAIGHDTLVYGGNNGSANTAVGSSALVNAGGDDNNTAVGYMAGNSVNGGSGNILVGSNVDVPTATTSNFLNIGNTVYGDLSTDQLRVGGSGALSGFSDLEVAGTLAVKLSAGTTAQRPGTPANGMIRYNATTNKFEGYENGAWKDIIAAAGTLSFLDLSDTPAVYTGAAYKLAMVNAGETAIQFSGTDAVLLPSGTTAERPATATNGMIRYNGTDNRFEVYQNGAWVNLITSGAGSALALNDLTDAYTDYGAGKTIIIGSNGNIGGGWNTYLGVGVASYNSVGYYNIAFGNSAGAHSGGNNNVFLGQSAGAGTAGTNISNNNTVVGAIAAYVLSTGDDNVTLGHRAGDSITTGSSNIIVGSNADTPTATTSNFLNIGDTVYGDLSTDQIRIGGSGALSGFSDLEVAGTLAVKLSAGTTAQRPGTPANGMIRYNATTNKFEGYENGAWKDIIAAAGTLSFLDLSDTPAVYTGAAYKLAMVNAGETAIQFSGTDAVLLPSGTTAERPGTATNGMIRYNGTDNKFEVYQNGAWVGLVTSGSALAIDDLSDAKSDYATDFNLLVGTPADAWAIASGGQYNLTLGQTAGDSITTGDRNIAIGYGALTTGATMTDNIAIGYNALTLNQSGGTDNIAIGSGALDANTTGTNQVAIGTDALGATTFGTQSSIAIGSKALEVSTGGIYNTAVGPSAQRYNTAGDNNVALGTSALLFNQAGNHNTAIGFEALRGLAPSTHGYNTAVGFSSLRVISTGADNTALGNNAGLSITTGSGNILVGSNVDAPTATTSNFLNIGGTVYGDLSTDQLRVGGSGALSGFSDLEVAGTLAVKLSSGTTAQRPATPAGGMVRYNTDTTPKDVIEYYDAESAAWIQIPTGTAGGAVLSSITAATADNTIGNAAWNQTWNWALTGTTEDGFTFGEDTAATGGSGDQSVLKATTLASSTAVPLMVTNLGNGISFRVNDATDDSDTTPFIVDASGSVAIGATSVTAGAGLEVATTNSMLFPRGTMAQRPGAPVNGMVRYDSTTNIFEGYQNGAWTRLSSLWSDSGSGYIEYSNSLGGVKIASVTGAASPVFPTVPTPTTPSFLDLTDTPSAYTGGGYKAVKVNAGATGLEFGGTDAIILPSGTTAQRPGTPANGMIRYNADNNKFEAYENSAWTNMIGGGGGGALSGITAATADNTIDNAAWNQTWNWALTGSTEDAFTFGESAASTGGSGDQSVLKATTLASSTAVPLMVTNLGDGLSLRVNDETGDADTTPFVVDASGNVGIGVSSPPSLLSILDRNNTAGITVRDDGNSFSLSSNTAVEHSNGPNYSSGINSIVDGGDVKGAFHAAMGSPAAALPKAYYSIIGMRVKNSAYISTSPAALVNGDYLPGIAFAGQTNATGGTGMLIGGAINGVVSGTVSSGNLPTDIVFQTSSTGYAGLGERMRIKNSGDVVFPGTGALSMQAGTTAQRPGTPTDGMIRYNSTTTKFEGYQNGAWGDIAAASIWTDSGSGYIEYDTSYGGIKVGSVSGAAAPTAGYALDDLRDVGATSPALGDVIAWDGTSAWTKASGLTSTIRLPSGTTAQRPGTPANGMIRYNSTNNKFEAYENGAWTNMIGVGGGGALSSITAAAADNTINSSGWNQTWNWALTGATEDGFTFGEDTAATGGSGDQSVLKATTLASSTAVPLMVTNLGNGISFRVNDATDDSDTSPFVVDASGNVGIGTVAPTVPLQVVGDVQVKRSTGTTGLMTLSQWSGGNAILASAAGSTLPASIADLHIMTGNTANCTNPTSGCAVTAMTFKNTTGYVGIGTTSPSHPLTLETSTAGSPTLLALKTTLGGGNATGIGFYNSGTQTSRIYAYDSSLNLSTENASPIIFLTNATEKARITSAGQVGIRLTNPAFDLEIGYDSLYNGSGRFAARGSTATNFSNTTSVEASDSVLSSGVVNAIAYGGNTVAPFHAAISSNGTNSNAFSIIGMRVGSADWNPAFVAALSNGAYLPGPAFAGQTDTNAGTGMVIGAAINGVVNGTVSSGVLPTDLIFRTSATNSTGLTEYMRIKSNGDVTMSGTGALTIPAGTTGERPVTPVNGMMRYNSTNNKFEVYQGGAWGDVLVSGSSLALNDLTDVITGNGGGHNMFLGGGGSSVTGAAFSNVSLGNSALNLLTSGTNNTALGRNALQAVTSGGGNTGIGANALTFGNGSNNTLVGAWVAGNATSSNNTAVGYSSANALGSGANNTFFGYQSGNSVTSGSGNLLLGYDVDTPTATTSNFLNIGDTVYGDLSTDQIRIGGSGSLSGFSDLEVAGTLAVKLSSGTTAQRPGTPANGMMRYNSTTAGFEVYEAGAWVAMGASVSDRRLKTDIKPLERQAIVDKLMQVDTYSFRLKADQTGRKSMGVIAQEIEKVFPDLVDGQGDEMKSVRYVELIAPLIETGKYLKSENDTLRADVRELKDQVALLNKAAIGHTGKASMEGWALLVLGMALGGHLAFFLKGGILRRKRG